MLKFLVIYLIIGLIFDLMFYLSVKISIWYLKEDNNFNSKFYNIFQKGQNILSKLLCNIILILLWPIVSILFTFMSCCYFSVMIFSKKFSTTKLIKEYKRIIKESA